ncbi:MAG: CoA-acylating methylmalonate-semialdehyde dehydrogenase [Proteobacteria bacterium]|nr:CoA-acylating methylmalonate-semialdehyde dehydrogenase [Pseudomonadota bacterium]MDA1300619.1 CoA-acylating methylmalonate-semialdehyde dehydrogenase [Pseudomonadota bacterium]
MTNQLKIYADGFRQSETRDFIPVLNPANQEVLAEVPCATPAEIDAAVAAAGTAFEAWRDVPTIERCRLMMLFQAKLKEHQEELAGIIARESGKTFVDAMGDVWRGIEVAEQACNMPSLMMGETSENVARGIDTYSIIQPVGVCVGITPFNFPAMIPLWMFPLAIASGNTFILKPSEQDPMTPTRMVELFYECGFPENVLQLIHGGRDQVEALITHRDTRAVSFVGSVGVGQHVYRLGTQHLKRVQCMTGAKNHLVIMPDANKSQAINALVGASLGAAGQRCMAVSAAVFVGAAGQWLPDLRDAMAAAKPGVFDDESAAYGPLISVAARERILGYIEAGKKEGATCLLDGSECSVPGMPDGNWVGPTLFSDVTSDMSIYREEIFGPVLAASQVDSLDAAIEFVNASPFGNGVSLFTSSGGSARKFQNQIQVGQVGINVPIPVPLPFFSFTGWKDSFIGDHHAYGKQAVRFYTETKTVTARWFDTDVTPGESNMTIALK